MCQSSPGERSLVNEPRSAVLFFYYQLWNSCFSQYASSFTELAILLCVAPLGEYSLALRLSESSICIIEGTLLLCDLNEKQNAGLIGESAVR